MTIQIVARPFDDEELLAATEVVDRVVNGGVANGIGIKKNGTKTNGTHSVNGSNGSV